MTDSLEAEGYAREIARRVQAARKNAGLNVGDKIQLALQINKKISLLLEKSGQIDYIEQKTNSSELQILELNKEISGYEHKAEDKIKDYAIVILFNKV